MKRVYDWEPTTRGFQARFDEQGVEVIVEAQDDPYAHDLVDLYYGEIDRRDRGDGVPTGLGSYWYPPEGLRPGDRKGAVRWGDGSPEENGDRFDAVVRETMEQRLDPRYRIVFFGVEVTAVLGGRILARETTGGIDVTDQDHYQARETIEGVLGETGLLDEVVRKATLEIRKDQYAKAPTTREGLQAARAPSPDWAFTGMGLFESLQDGTTLLIDREGPVYHVWLKGTDQSVLLDFPGITQEQADDLFVYLTSRTPAVPRS